MPPDMPPGYLRPPELAGQEGEEAHGRRREVSAHFCVVAGQGHIVRLTRENICHEICHGRALSRFLKSRSGICACGDDKVLAHFMN